MLPSEARLAALKDLRRKFEELLSEAEKQQYFKEEYLDTYFYSLAHAIDDAVDTVEERFKDAIKR